MPGESDKTEIREREDILHAFLFAKALPSLSGFTVEQQRGLIRDAWNTADRTMELVRDEAQLRMRPIVERHLRPHEKPASPFRRCRSCDQEISHLAPSERYCLRHRGDADV